MLDVLQKKKHVSVGEQKNSRKAYVPEKNSCRQVGRKKIPAPKIFYPPPVISNGPSLNGVRLLSALGSFVLAYN